MENYERVKYLRKEILKLSQKDFAQRIHISRSNLGNIETNKINLTERVLADICRTFHVNQNWLRAGIQPVFEEASSSLDIRLLNLYAELTDDNKKYLQGYLQRLLEEQSSDSGRTS